MKKIQPQNLFINPNVLEKRYEKLASQIIFITEEDKEKLIALFEQTGVQYSDSPSEAETLCASLSLDGKVDAVITNDSDICAYGVKKFLYSINSFQENCIEIDLDQILLGLDLTFEQFRDFCIMCGCDYNTNIPGVGPVNAYKLIKKHGSIENIPMNVSVLNHVRCRELFSLRYEFEDDILSTIPNAIELENFLKMRGYVSYPNVVKGFQPAEIVFED